MDTCGKTNIEFRNEVNETLVRHESSFDQLNAALQTIVTELQAIRTTQHTQVVPPDTTHLHRNLLPIEQPAPLLLLVLITHIHHNSSCISQSSTEKTQLVGFIELNNTLSFRTLELHNAYS
jgi:hypothetical protein